jgi:SAM-dependent methyltransferase
LSAPRIFDQHHYDLLNRARGEVVSRLLTDIQASMGLRTAVDVGCGLGHFASLLSSLGFEVSAVDGRSENALEAARRLPTIKFHTLNVEDPQLVHLGTFDLVFCFGLLYHLENPLLALRNLHAMTNTLLLVEGLVYPGDEPIMALVDETEYEDQGLRHFAFYPSEACLVKMMYRVGYSNVYRFAIPPAHPEYQEVHGRPKNRTVLAASLKPLATRLLSPIEEPRNAAKPWLTAPNGETSPISRLRHFAARPLSQKLETIKRLVKGK